MPQELKSLLIWVSVIVVVALLVPVIETIIKALRRNSQQPVEAVPVRQSSKRFSN